MYTKKKKKNFQQGYEGNFIERELDPGWRRPRPARGDNICRIICGFHSCNLRTKEATYFPTPMASIRSLGKWTVDHQIFPQHTTIQAKQAVVSIPISRRAAAILISSLPFSVISLPKCSEARERRNKKAIPLEAYHTTCNFELSFPTHFKK